jgi:hypothetical protein
MSIECKVPECGNPVFSTGLCRKHYEQGRLATASPCSIAYVERNYLTTSNTPDIQCAPG